jgi:hypothetical protein
MKRILLIAGCSHSAGSEIDGTEDSSYNRSLSYGNLIAKELGYTPRNISLVGATNTGIARSVLKWFREVYDPDSMSVSVLVSWSEPIRMEIPASHKYLYQTANPYADWYDTTQDEYMKVIIGWEGFDEEEKRVMPQLHKFMVENEQYLQIMQSANLILQLQYFFKAYEIDYIMCNAMQQYTPDNIAIKEILDLVDTTKYYKLHDHMESFYPKYQGLGYVNEKAKYWHHGEEPHRLFAEELLQFNEETKCLKKYSKK